MENTTVSSTELAVTFALTAAGVTPVPNRWAASVATCVPVISSL